MKFSPIGIPPDQSQFLETRKFQTEEICRIFIVPPHLVADLDKDGNTKAVLAIQQTRKDFERLQVLELHEFNFIADKTSAVHSQAYEYAKANGFIAWEDDTVEEIPPSTIVDEIPIEE